MADKKKKVDELAGKGSFLDRLRIRRRLLDEGDPMSANLSMKKKKAKKKNKEDKGYK